MKRWPESKAFFWEEAPFFRLLAPLAAGIFFYDCVTVGRSSAIFVLSILLLLCLALLLLRNGRIRTLLFPICILLAGWLSAAANDIRNHPSWFGHYRKQAKGFTARIVSEPAERESTWKLELEIEQAICSGGAKPVKGKALLYCYKKGSGSTLKKNDRVVLPPLWVPITNAGNPGEFDRARYCARNNLYYQQFLPADGILLLRRNSAQAGFIERCHDQALRQLALRIRDRTTLGMLQAMLIGDDANLDQDLRQSYALTGIVHIIAISGSHVVVFFLLISALLFWIRHKKYQWVIYACSLPVLWCYVLIAGAPPSALRSALMFSFIGGGLMLSRSPNTLNQLFASAFFLLLIDPGWLFSIGFQLSFIAVLSLVLFYSRIYSLWPIHNAVLKKLWAVTAASLAAQILVAPLIVYYFHMFPLYFLPANILAYLVMGLLLTGGMAIILLSMVPSVAIAVAGAITAIMIRFNQLVEMLERLNPEALGNLYFNGAEVLLLYAVIICFSTGIVQGRVRMFLPGLAVTALLLISLNIREWGALQRDAVVIYNVPGVTVVDRIYGKYYTAIGQDTGVKVARSYAIKNAHIAMQAWRPSKLVPQTLVCLGGKHLLVLNSPGLPDTCLPFSVHYLLLNYPVEVCNAGRLQALFRFERLILGSGQKRYRVKQWADSCRKAGIPLSCTADSGALVFSRGKLLRPVFSNLAIFAASIP